MSLSSSFYFLSFILSQNQVCRPHSLPLHAFLSVCVSLYVFLYALHMIEIDAHRHMRRSKTGRCSMKHGQETDK